MIMKKGNIESPLKNRGEYRVHEQKKASLIENINSFDLGGVLNSISPFVFIHSKEFFPNVQT